jgi:hypothetical protein
MVELRGSRRELVRPVLARRLSAADTQKTAMTPPPVVQRRLSQDDGHLGKSLVLEKNWELYRKDIEEAQKVPE